MKVKNFLIKTLFHLVKRFRKENSSEKHSRFLVVSTTGLGDTLWGTPALRALKEKYPNAYIGVLTSRIGYDVLKYNPHVNELFLLKKSTFFCLLRIYFKLKQKSIDTVLLFHASQRAVLPLCFFIGARTLIGTQKINKGLDFILTNPVENRSIHEIERRLEIIYNVGASATNPLLELYLSDKDTRSADTFLKERSIPHYIPLVGLHPGAKDKFKRWPAENFIKIGKLLQEHLGCQIIVTGNVSETDLVKEVSSNIPGAIAIQGELPLRTVAALIGKMSLMIANDTGPMHIAFSLQTPTIAIFTPTDPRSCGPYHASKVKVIEKQATCSPCLRKKCQDPFCLLQIGIQEVYDEALKLFYTKNGSYAAF